MIYCYLIVHIYQNLERFWGKPIFIIHLHHQPVAHAVLNASKGVMLSKAENTVYGFVLSFPTFNAERLVLICRGQHRCVGQPWENTSLSR